MGYQFLDGLMCVLATVALVQGGSSVAEYEEASICGNWNAYKAEKCLKIVESVGLVKMEDAENICRNLNTDAAGSTPGLLTIKTQEEQKFIEEFLFVENELLDNVWLGLRKRKGEGLFEWDDRSEMVFFNWANQTLSDDVNPCVEIKSGDAFVETGLWVRVNCKRKRAVVCEKRPTWTLETLQHSFLNFKLEQTSKQMEWKQKQVELEKKQVELEQKDEKMQQLFVQKQEEMQQEIDTLKQCAVPVGFVYVQLAFQEPPSSLWPTTNWTEISANYSGLFFRVAGGNATKFGETQGYNSPRFSAVTCIQSDTSFHNPKILDIPPSGTWTSSILTGGKFKNGNRNNLLKFQLSSGEVRPRNQAVRIWQRIQ